MTARVAKGRCPSQKTRYRNKNAVRAGIDTTRQAFRRCTGRDAPPLFFYRCQRCRGWHMTHLEPYNPKRQGDAAA